MILQYIVNYVCNTLYYYCTYTHSYISFSYATAHATYYSLHNNVCIKKQILYTMFYLVSEKYLFCVTNTYSIQRVTFDVKKDPFRILTCVYIILVSYVDIYYKCLSYTSIVHIYSFLL